MQKRTVEKAQREIHRVTKNEKLQIRLNEVLKERYEKALQQQGLSMTDHITNKILEFCLLTESEARKKALHKK